MVQISQPKYQIYMLILALCLILLSGFLFRSLYLHQQQIKIVHENRYQSYLLATQLRRSSDELTRLVRTYAATSDPRFEKQFWQVLAIRNGEAPLPLHYDRVYWDFLAVKEGKPPYQLYKSMSLNNLLKKSGFTDNELLLLAESQQNSDQLVFMEKLAMHAMKGEFADNNGEFNIRGAVDQKMAIDILYGSEYHYRKINIMSPINQFYEQLDERTKQQVDNATENLDYRFYLQVNIYILTILTIAVLMFTIAKHNKNVAEVAKYKNDKILKKTKQLNHTNIELQHALDEIKTLRGIIPICSYCHHIRDDDGAWEVIDLYLAKHSEAKFSHGICPECLTKVRSERGLEKK